MMSKKQKLRQMRRVQAAVNVTKLLKEVDMQREITHSKKRDMDEL